MQLKEKNEINGEIQKEESEFKIIKVKTTI